MTFEILLGRRQRLVFENLYMPPPSASGKVRARHIMLVISGFLSESGAHSKSWQHVMTLCRNSGTPLYTVKWEAKSYEGVDNVALTAAK